MTDAPAVQPDSDEPQTAIPIDLAPLLAPYGSYRRLSVRVIHLRSGMEFSAGTKNDDASWSFTPEQLQGLALLLNEGVEAPIALAVRIIGFDRDENATIVGQFDVPLMAIRGDQPARRPTAGPEAPSPGLKQRMERRVAAALRLGERRTRAAVAAAEQRWQADWAKQFYDQTKLLEKEWQQKLATELAARGKAEAEAEITEKKITALQEELAAAADRLTEELESQASALEAQWAEAEAARRADALEQQAAELGAQWAEHEAARQAEAVARAVTEAEARLSVNQPPADEALEVRIAEAVGAAEAAGKARHEAAMSAAESAFEGRLREAVAQAEAETEARLAAALAGAEKEAEQRQAEAVRLALQEVEADWQRQQDDAGRKLAEAEGRAGAAEAEAIEAEERARQLEIRLAEAKDKAAADLEHRLAEQAAYLEKESQRECLAARSAQAEVEEKLSAAESKAAEVGRKLSETKSALDTALARVATLEGLEKKFEEDRQRLARDTERRLTEELAKQASASQVRWQAESESRVAEALKNAQQRAESRHQARLDALRSDLERTAQANLSAAEAKWRADEAKRFAQARTEWQKEVHREAAQGRRKLRSLARKQLFLRLGGHLRRLVLLGLVVAGAGYLYIEYKSLVMESWLPKGRLLAEDLYATGRAEVEDLLEPAELRLAVAAERANLRSRPTTDATVLSQLPRDSEVVVLESWGEWLRVQPVGQEEQQGWLHISVLQPVTER
jgi:hypothetical protein